jgi:hypothetical protein
MTEELKPTHSNTEANNISPPAIEQSHETNSNVKREVSLQHTKDKPCECGSKECCSCNANTNGGNMAHYNSYVYAIGKTTYKCPNESIEVELAQAIGLSTEEQTRGRTGEEVVHAALTDPANRYIARQICYVLKIEGLETYILVAADPLDIDRLAQSLKPTAAGMVDNDVIIGRRGPIAPPDMCAGLQVPIVLVDQIYSFDRDTLIKAIPRRKGENEDQFKKTANELFNHIIQITDNAGATDEHRAMNYAAVKSAGIYERTQLMQNENYSLSAVDVRTSALSGTRNIKEVIFSYENRANRATQKWFVRVDVSGEFPHLVSPMQEYFER